MGRLPSLSISPQKGIKSNYYVHQREDGERNARNFFLNCLHQISGKCANSVYPFLLKYGTRELFQVPTLQK